MPEPDGIAEFWAWWPAGRVKLEAAIISGDYTDELVAEIGGRVGAIDGELDWELAAGDTAEHAFCLSACGDTEKRLLTEIWRSRGPGHDETWEFHAARKRGDLDAKLTIAGFELELGSLVVAFELDDSRERADAKFFHALFPEMGEELAQRITFLALDTAFGEDGVERWIGAVEVVTEEPADAEPIAFLVEAVDAMALTATGEQFAILKGEDDGGAPLFATLNLALKRIDHLLCFMHITVDVAILAPDEHGLTSQEEAEVLNTNEDELTEALGSSVVYYGRETRRGRRVLHYFAPEDGPAAQTIERWAAAHADRDVAATFTRDPAWEVMRRFS